MTSTPESRLAELGIELPAPSAPAGAYVGAVEAGDLVFLSGQGPITDGAVVHAGRVGADLSLEQGYAAARLTGLNLLAALRAQVGSLDRVKRVVKLLGWVSSAPDFYDQAKVLNGTSELMAEVFGDAGVHARSAIAAPHLVLDIAVEVEMIVQLHPAAANATGVTA